MLRGDMTGWTSRVYDLKVENREKTDKSGFREVKTIYFVLATDRGFTSKVVNGQVVRDKQTDFVFCRAHGRIAQVIKDFCSDKHADTNKIVSRKLSVWGHVEAFTTEKEIISKPLVAIPMPDKTSKTYQVTVKVPVPQTGFVFVVRDLEIHDPKKTEPAGVITEVEEIVDSTVEQNKNVLSVEPIEAINNFSDSKASVKTNNTGNNAGNVVSSSSSVQNVEQNTTTSAQNNQVVGSIDGNGSYVPPSFDEMANIPTPF